ncbi:MAG: 2-C-methyl-D-erythritol 4-phosphate cytidylyltransferase [Candidatus Omnitrophica bacterium]|nr:2-C-methyl-D-erythritol 4-phosphate cytidylyltransferase [Candidatus Omnitrophota bacterium]MBU4590921.1 2-C-methyl-D-erythritol 4-phosphate cytidylyltransferase [Candidatus Omnitrophota bacterium]
MRVAAIVPAAGKGRRIKSKIHKPYLEICGKPILAHTLLRLSRNKHIDEIIVAVNKKKIKTFRRGIVDRFNIRKIKVVSGGRERKDSVLNALKEVSGNIGYVLIHDGVRPFITDKLINSSLKTAQRFRASVVAVPVKSTLKYVKKDGFVHDTADRRRFWEAQTPQVFRKELIKKAYARFGRKKINITDDSMLVERIGVRPKIVRGSYSNIKITTPEDLKLAKLLHRP